MILLVDNYDSFSYNLYQLSGEIRTCVKVIRNDEMSIDEIREMRPDRIIISPGPGRPENAGISVDIVRELAGEVPILGVCLGMQLLFDKSNEYGECEGLGLIHGEIRNIAERVPETLKIPHMGWNALHFTKPHPLFRYINEGDHVYFVHSFSAVGCEESTIAVAEYGADLTASVAKDNIMGCQFHPEKSGTVGLNILKAFCEM